MNPLPLLPSRERLQPVMLAAAIGAGLVAAAAMPDSASKFAGLIAPCAFTAMLAVMLDMDPGAIAGGWRRWRPMVLALTLNALVAPALAFSLTRLLLADDPAMALGLLLYLMLPCTGWYLLFTRMARGDLALGLNLLPLNLLLPAVLLPVYLPLLGRTGAPLEAAVVMRSVTLFIVTPALLAYALRRLARRFSGLARWQSAAQGTTKSAAFLVLVFALFASQGSTLFDSGSRLARLVMPELAFFAVMAGLAWWAAARLSVSSEEAITLTFTATARNAEVAIAVAATAFGPLVAQTTALAPMIELPFLVLLLRAVLALPCGNEIRG
jgi:ACR3 family arsenite efflux pump ArsB